VGDFGGGGMYLAFGVVCALLEAKRSGRGQVVDAAMVDGAASLAAAVFGLRAVGMWNDERGDNILDSGAPWYDVYETQDGEHVAIGSIEKRFYGELLRLTGLEDEPLPPQHDKKRWGELRAKLTEVFKQKTRAEWCRIMEGSDVCFAPVLSLAEAPAHAHNRARGTFVEVAGVVQPGPAPRFSRTPGAIARPPARAGEHTEEALRDWGFSPDDLSALRAQGALG
jgi:alpha-methylacyl-CoA racemase